MILFTLVRRGLAYYLRAHLAVAAGAALAAAVLTGALLVGDSLRGTLRERALARIGTIQSVWFGGDRMKRGADVLLLPGVVSTGGGERRASGVQVLGVPSGFLATGSGESLTANDDVGGGSALINATLARRLQVGPGDELLIRVDRPSALSQDMILQPVDEATAAFRIEVKRIVGAEELGDFSLAASPTPALNLFVERDWLQARLDAGPVGNLDVHSGPPPELDALLAETWALPELGYSVRAAGPGGMELVSDRVFLEPPLAAAAEGCGLPILGVLTYFVNSIAANDRATPYSMVSAIGTLGGEAPLPSFWPADLGDDAIVVNEWLAQDLGVAVGDEVTLSYWVPGPDRRLEEASRVFRVATVVPLEGDAADPTLMPAFPGLSDSQHCRDWEPGVAIELDRIRDVDEAYWDEHRGTPKAFVTLAAGQDMWANRFGELTAIRAPTTGEEELLSSLQSVLDPADLGLFARDLRGPALASATPSNDLGGYFLGLSFFLIASAALLTALLFAFGVERRAGEVGLLLAVGYRHRTVRALWLAEAGVVALVGAVGGAALGVAYTALVLRGLAGVWSGAVGGGAGLELFVPGSTLATGAAAAALVAWLSIVLALRGVYRRPARELLARRAGVSAAAPPAHGLRRALLVAAVAGAAGLLVALVAGDGSGAEAAGAFFGAGALLLAAALALGRALLLRMGRPTGGVPGVAALGLRGAARRPARSLATVGTVAGGVFLVVAVGANRLRPPDDPTARDSGTGGFALVAESGLSLAYDPATPEGREWYGVPLDDGSVVPLRVRAGDDASCLNLALPQEPRLLGVDPDALSSRGAFRFAATWDGAPEIEGSPWTLLDRDLGDGTVAAIGDAASVRWTMHAALGDVVTYRDERGAELRARIVATLADSMLQGDLLIDEAVFQERFPSESGYRRLLIDSPPEGADALAAELSRALADEGLEVRPAADRLAEFQAVQNTFLSIFEALGGLGVALGTLGLGIVVLRNVQDRRGELGLVRAIGWSRRDVRRLVLLEHGLLLALGLAAGAFPAAVAVAPAFRGAGAAPSLVAPAVFVLGVLVVGGLAVLLATGAALRGPLLAALRSE